MTQQPTNPAQPWVQPPTPPGSGYAWTPTADQHSTRWSAPAPPPTPRRRRGPLFTLGVAAAALTVIAAAALALAAALSGGGAGSRAATMNVAWSIPAVHGNVTGIALAGSWVTDGTIVDGRPDGLLAYDLAGRHKWGLAAPSGLRACQMSATTSRGIGLLAYGADQYTCDQVAAVDLTTGQQLWRKDLADHSLVPSRLSDPALSVSGDTAAVRTVHSIIALSLSGGAQKWAVTPADNILSDAPTCMPQQAAAGNGVVYALFSCFGTTSDTLQLVGYDANSGKQTWQGETAGMGTSSTTIEAASPLILADTRAKCAYAYTAAATAPVKLDLAALNYEAFTSLGGGQNMRPHAYAIVGTTLYAETADRKPLWNTVEALDLATGRKLWETSLGQGTLSTIISADTTGVRGVTEQSGQNSYQLVTYAAATGKVSYGASTSDARFTFTPQDALYLSSGHLVDLPAALLGSATAREIIVLTGAR